MGFRLKLPSGNEALITMIKPDDEMIDKLRYPHLRFIKPPTCWPSEMIEKPHHIPCPPPKRGYRCPVCGAKRKERYRRRGWERKVWDGQK